ncbi:putative pyroglutamyl peptidase type I [Naviculisporaceae sp. PSN 640]
MGSTSNAEEITVLITGFGPFKADFPINPSWEIARQLPKYLPPIRAKSKSASAASSLPAHDLPPVRLLVHPEAIRVNYQTVRALVPKLWDGEDLDTEKPDSDNEKPKIDYAIHIGMAGPKLVYSIERRGHRDGYSMKDVDGEFLRDQDKKLKEGRDWIWYDEPQELLTDFDLDDVLKRWKGHSPDNLDLRISEDAGRFLCDFIYFSSLAHLHKAGRKRNVVFLHVPADLGEQNIANGKELVIQLVRSLVESELARQGKLGKPKSN